MRELPYELSVTTLRDMYMTKETTPETVIREIIRRAELDAGMNIWITPPSMPAIRPYLDRLHALDPANAPLWGIPFAVKDNIDVAGMPTTAGCAEFSYTPEQDAEVVRRLVDAGAIPVGKTNLDQFATGLVGTRSPYGETHNALKAELISGGSSSGSAVAVARGQAAFALGTDTAGSGRVPAALNRLIGYKPSLGAWSTKGVVPACASLDCVTVFTSSLRDAIAVDAAARGVNNSDPWSRFVPRPVPRLPRKICLLKEPLRFFGPFAKQYEHAWNTACKRLKALQIPVEYVDSGVFAEAAAILYEGPWVAERWAGLGGFIESNPSTAFPVTEQILRSGSGSRYSAASVFEAMHQLQKLKLEARKLLQEAVLVMPTCGGTWTRDQVRMDPVQTNREMGLYTNHCNLLDLCAVAIPAGNAETDVPFGITLFALAANEALICGAAAEFANGLQGISTNGCSTHMMKDSTLLAVCGLHMRGYPLEQQMRDCGARFVCETMTAAAYQLVKLPMEPAKPGLIKRAEGGASIYVELWEMPLQALGSFAASIPAPLGIGKVQLHDGTEVPGFVCEAYASAAAEDITASGGWRQHEHQNSLKLYP